jgi:hypothetical protein
MAQHTRPYRYPSAPPLTQRTRVETSPRLTFDWREVRNWFLPALLLVVVGGLYLLQSSFATTSELEIARLAKERDAALRRNIQLSVEIAELDKPARIHERALALGLVDTNKSIKLIVPATAVEPAVVTANPLGNPLMSDELSPWQQFLNEFARWMNQSTQ